MNRNLNNKIKQKLKRFNSFLLFTIYVNGFCNSKHILPAEETPSEGEKRAKTASGELLGDGITKKIGEEGGMISLPNTFSLIIPAGALQGEFTFGIEMIKNTNPAAVGEAYRLTPTGILFFKPVTIEFYLQKINTDISVPDALAVAYQTKEGYWNMLESRKTDGKLTAVIRHLGDFGAMQWLSLKPLQFSVPVNKTVELELVRYIPVPAQSDDFLVLPLDSEKKEQQTPVLQSVPLETKYIKEWKNDGPGVLFNYRNKAKYQAFSSLLHGNTVKVSVELKTKSRKIILVSNLEIILQDYLNICINGGKIMNLIGVNGCYLDGDETLLAIFGTLPSEQTKNALLVIKAHKGYDVRDNSNTDWENFIDATLKFAIYSAGRYIEQFGSVNSIPDKSSLESLQRFEINKVGEYVSGNFFINAAGFWEGEHQYTGIGTIEGEFNIFLPEENNDFPKKRGFVYTKLKHSLERQIYKLFKVPNKVK